MLRRAEVVDWKQSRKPPMRLRGVSVAIVLGAWESYVRGEGPQPERYLQVRPWRMEMPVNTGRYRQEGSEGKCPLRRSPCAVKAARTVTTGGMEKRIVRYRALSLPTGIDDRN